MPRGYAVDSGLVTRLLWRVGSQTFANRPQCGLRARGKVELAQDVAHVGAGCALANDQLGGNLLVGLAGCDHLKDLSLASGELRSRVLGLRCAHRRHQTLGDHGVELELPLVCGTDCARQLVGVGVLEQIAGGSRSQSGVDIASSTNDVSTTTSICS